MKWISYAGLYVGSFLIFDCIVSGITHRPQKEKGEYFDKYNSLCLKGIAMLLIMFCHYMGTFGDGVTYFTPLGGIGVTIFLMLSAYGLNESFKKNGLNRWWVKRILTVFLPYICVQLVLYWPFEKINFRKFVFDMTLIHPQYIIGWYLNYLLICYVVFYLIKKIRILRKNQYFFFLFFSVITFFFFEEIKSEQSFAFMTGIFLSDHSRDERVKRYFNCKTGSIMIFIGMVFLLIKQVDIVRCVPLLLRFIQLIIKWFCGVGLSILFISFDKRLKITLFAFIGAISYELYLFHGYVLLAVPISLKGAAIFIVVSLASASFLHILLNLKQMFKINENK